MHVNQSLANNYFDIICAFNAFYAFSNQTKALSSLNRVAKLGAKQVIFDYAYQGSPHQCILYRSGKDGRTPFIPISLNHIDTMLQKTGWRLDDIIDVSDDYLRWYDNLLKTLHHRKNEVILKFGKDAFLSANATYTRIKRSLVTKNAYGSIVYAEKIKNIEDINI